MPKTKPPPKRADKDSFEATAERLECDTDMDRFIKKLGKIAKATPGQKAVKNR